MNHKPVDRHRRSLQADSLSGFLPPTAIFMADSDSAPTPFTEPQALHESESTELQTSQTEQFERSTSGLLFFVAQEDVQVPGARELFTKMLGALGIEANIQAQVVELSDEGGYFENTPDFGGNLVVALGEEAAMRLGILDSGGVRALVTHSLQSLISEPALKRESWQHLQLAAKEVGWAIGGRR
jgi:hypothetical protein